MKQLLEGVRVLDFTRVLAGPFCTMILADLGAEVIKIETPKYGDDVRFFGPFKNKESVYFMNVNRNKKSITLNLKHEKSKEIVKKLIEKSDVLVENFKPGVIGKLGFGYEDVKKIKTDMIYASISGFGQYGPYSNNAAYDLVIQAMSGLMSVTGFQDKPPVKVGTSISDILSGMFAAIGILASLYNKEKDNDEPGQNIDVAMLDSAIAVLENQVVKYTANNEIASRIGSRHSAGGPHNVYKTQNGYIVIACGNESIWKRLTKVIGHEELGDHPDFNSMSKRAQNIEVVDNLVEEWTMKRTKEEALNALREIGIPSGPVNNINDVVEDEHVNARKMLQDIDHPLAGRVKIHGFPIKFSNAEAGVKRSSPTLGQNNKEVLCDLLGYSKDEYLQLIEEKIL